MVKIPISGLQEIDDPFYRYTMDRMNLIKNGSFYLIDNLPTICKELDRDDKLLVKYFNLKFNVSFVYKNGILRTQKDIKLNDYEEALHEFIEYFVLCPRCKLPETILESKYVLKCKACSYDDNMILNNKIVKKIVKK